MAGDNHGLAFLDEFEETGELALGLMHVHLHRATLARFLSYIKPGIAFQ
jgi:hypothetical protein